MMSKVGNVAGRRRIALARVRAWVLDEIGAVEVIVHFAREIVERDLGAGLDRVVAGPIGRVILDDPRLFMCRPERSCWRRGEPGYRQCRVGLCHVRVVAAARRSEYIRDRWRRRSAVLGLVVGNVEEVQEIAGAVPPLHLEAVWCVVRR